MSPAGCELAIPGSERPRVYALDRGRTGIGCSFILLFSSTKVRMRIVPDCTYYTLHFTVAIRKKKHFLTDPIRKSTQTFYFQVTLIEHTHYYIQA